MTNYEKLLKTSSLVPASELVAFGKWALSNSSSSSSSSRLVLVDASWYLPNVARNGEEEFLQRRIKVQELLDLDPARVVVKFANVDGIVDKSSAYPHMLPSIEVFNEAIRSLDIKKDDTLLVYDSIGIFSATRIAWMFELFHLGPTFVLDTFPEYLAAVGPEAAFDTKAYSSIAEYNQATATATATAGDGTSSSVFVSSDFDSDRVLSYEQVVEIATDKDFKEKYIILDARPYGRFTGKDPEPRAGLRSGHIPGAASLAVVEVLHGPDNFNKFKSPEELNKAFAAKGVTKESLKKKQLVLMCGSGVTACIVERAARVAGLTGHEPSATRAKVYDGSWTEWAARAPDELIVTGA